MKDGRGWKPLIRWPGRQAWKKGFGLSCGPDPCLLDWHSNNPATGLILQITPPTRERRQARIGGNQTDERKRQGEGGGMNRQITESKESLERRDVQNQMDGRWGKANREWIERGKGKKQQRAKLAERDEVKMERALRRAGGGPGDAALSRCFSFIQQWLCLALMSVAALGYRDTDSVCWCCKGEEVVEGEKSRVFGWHNQITPPPPSPFFSLLYCLLFHPSLRLFSPPPLLISMIECPPPSFACYLPGSASMPSISKPSATTTLLPTIHIFLPAKQA